MKRWMMAAGLAVAAAGCATAAQAEDLAALAKGAYAYDFLKKPAVSKALKAVLPAGDYQTMMDYAKNGVSIPGEEHGGIVTAGVCKAHDCAANRVDLAFDHKGHVAVAVTSYSLYGDATLLIPQASPFADPATP